MRLGPRSVAGKREQRFANPVNRRIIEIGRDNVVHDAHARKNVLVRFADVRNIDGLGCRIPRNHLHDSDGSLGTLSALVQH
jgi:hypothetical protein